MTIAFATVTFTRTPSRTGCLAIGDAAGRHACDQSADYTCDTAECYARKCSEQPRGDLHVLSSFQPIGDCSINDPEDT